MEELYTQTQQSYTDKKEAKILNSESRMNKYKDENAKLSNACDKLYEFIMANVKVHVSNRKDYGCANILVYDYPTSNKSLQEHRRNVFFNPNTSSFSNQPENGSYSTVHLLNGTRTQTITKYFGIRNIKPILVRLKEELKPFKLFHGFPNAKAGNVIQVRWDDYSPNWAINK